MGNFTLGLGGAGVKNEATVPGSTSGRPDPLVYDRSIMEGVTLTIDGRQITVEKGRTVLQACLEHGRRVPYYCYHPALGVDGSCRVCIVKIEKMPKLQTACSTMCTDGMVIHTDTPDVIAARASVFEFLLINHPLDCPVCDKGGECPLQDFSYTFGPNTSRMDFPRRVFDGEGVRADVDFGPTLLLNRNRCILCTRCVRFMREVDGDAQINIIDRGYGSEIATFQEKGVHSILSGNLMDVCPVGAITTRDYRFKSRPWDNPQVVDTICTFCSRGCNTSAWLRAKPEWARGARLVRITPRFNPDVNGYWMCDIGRFGYHWVEGDDRLKQPFLRTPSGVQQPADWTEAIERARDGLTAAGSSHPDAVKFLVSAHASLEELFTLRQLARGLMGEEADEAVTLSWRASDKPQPARTKFAVPVVDAPNVGGAHDLKFNVGDGITPNVGALRAAIERGDVAALYAINPGPAEAFGDIEWLIAARADGRVPLLIVQGVVKTPLTEIADVVLPGASSFEKEASYVSERGRVQAAARSLPLAGHAREDWRILADLGAALGVSLPYRSSADIRGAVAAAMSGNPAYLDMERLLFARPVGARTWLHASNPSERWKWDFMFQDLPPVKGAVAPVSGTPRWIRLQEVEEP
ncbi:MAG: (2Fe-2S)-binding protein [Acidobacteria bacterium]|nr:(2Fe-2S)-binding protein [Acidobacteriota bacterium]